MKIFVLILLSIISIPSISDVNNNTTDDELNFTNTMQKHLDAVSNRDLLSLKSTLSRSGNMQLILPQTEIIIGVDAFVEYHKQWFATPDWTFETKILNTHVKSELGMAIVEIIYREPLRDGKPYFNRMNVSYVLEKSDNHWYVIKDHASSVEKSTDKVDN